MLFLPAKQCTCKGRTENVTRASTRLTTGIQCCETTADLLKLMKLINFKKILAGLGVELMALCLIGRQAITGVTLPALL
jgi:hypothetical protein